MKAIQDAINNEDYKRAETLFQEYMKTSDRYDDKIAILDAAIREWQGDREKMWKAIQRGLQINNRNYELYIMLGNYYLSENLYQSWLCYENARFHCDVPEDRMKIEGLLENFRERYAVFAEKVSIVILSCDLLEYTKVCIESIRRTTPESVREIIVVDNGSKDGSVEWLREQTDIFLIENKTNMGFPGASCIIQI